MAKNGKQKKKTDLEADSKSDQLASDEKEKSSQADALDKEFEEIKAENERLNERILRLRADFDNFRKRTVKERSDIARRSNENLIQELIPVIDHFEMGLKTADENNVEDSVQDGFRLVYGQLVQAIEKAGVERIDAEGEEFNPHLHECISHIPSEEVPEGHVSAQTRCGYKIGSYILRAAQVVVSSGPANTGGQEDENQSNGE